MSIKTCLYTQSARKRGGVAESILRHLMHTGGVGVDRRGESVVRARIGTIWGRGTPQMVHRGDRGAEGVRDWCARGCVRCKKFHVVCAEGYVIYTGPLAPRGGYPLSCRVFRMTAGGGISPCAPASVAGAQSTYNPCKHWSERHSIASHCY